jgi:hypothetical protein
MEFIKKGSFYGKDVAEDMPDVAEDGGDDVVREKVEVKQEVKSEVVAITEIKESTVEKLDGIEIEELAVIPPKILQKKIKQPKEEVKEEVFEQKTSDVSEPQKNGMIQRKRGRPSTKTTTEATE